MGDMSVGASIFARDSFGRFIAESDAAGTRVVDRLVIDGARYARSLAPSKTGRLRATIQPIMFSSREGSWTVGTHYWEAQEEGASPHPITGQVRFYWTKMDRMWRPGSNTISHPGNPAVRFMEHSYDRVRGESSAVMRAAYPG